MNNLEKKMTIEASLTRREDPAENDGIIGQTVDAIRSVRFGQVQITIRESGIVRIDKTKR